MTYNIEHPYGSFTPDSTGLYRAQLVVNAGGAGPSSDDEVMVTAVESGVPLANAGPDQMVDVGTVGTLDGSASTDSDSDPLIYSWRAINTYNLTITDEDSVYAQFVLEAPGVEEAELTVSDGTWEHTDIVEISSNPPTITSVEPIAGGIGTIITIDGTNFSSSPARDTVTVGGVQATVISVSITQITAEVPAGPYPDPSMTIKVKVSGITHGPDTAIGPPFYIAHWVQQTSAATYDLHDVDFYGGVFGIAVGAVGTVNITTSLYGPWEANDAGTEEELWGVCVIDAGQAVVVGNRGTILRTENYGDSWISQASGTTEDLWAVSFTDAAHGIAVGMDATIAVTSDSGNTWTTTWRVNGLRELLQDVEMIDVNNAWAVGGGMILRTTNGGGTWQSQAAIDPDVGQAMCFTDQSTGTIVGSAGSVIRTINGADWFDSSIDTPNQIFDVSFSDANTGVVVGGFIYRTTNGGADWYLEWDTTLDFFGVHMINSDIGFAVGHGGVIAKRTTDP
jgi:photosystem II stability/assembly factor-like uncharacterized protein